MGIPIGVFDGLDALDAATAAGDTTTPPAGDGTAAPPDATAPVPDTSITFASDTLARPVGFALKDIPPPADLFVDVEDVLIMFVYNSDPAVQHILLNVRMLMADGTFIVSQFQAGPINTSRNFQEFSYNVGPGFLMGVQANILEVEGERGRTYVEVMLARGPINSFVGTATLIDAYIQTGLSPSWPPTVVETQLSGQGWAHSVTGTVPAAGADISEAVPHKTRWKLRAARFTLTTANAGGNRSVAVGLFDSAGNCYYRSAVTALQALNTTVTYSVSDVPAPASVAGDVQLTIPHDVTIDDSYTWRTITGGLNAGDQYTAPQYQVEEWLKGY